MSKSSCSGITPCERGRCPRGKVCGTKNRCITVGKDVWNRVCRGHHHRPLPLSPAHYRKKPAKPSKITSPPRRRGCDHTNVCQTSSCPRHPDGRRRVCSIKGNCVLHGGAAWKKSGCEKHRSPLRPISKPPGSSSVSFDDAKHDLFPGGDASKKPVGLDMSEDDDWVDHLRPVLNKPKEKLKKRLRAGWYARQYPNPWGDRCDIQKDGNYKCLLQRRNKSPYWASPSKSGAGQEACEDWSPRCQHRPNK